MIDLNGEDLSNFLLSINTPCQLLGILTPTLVQAHAKLNTFNLPRSYNPKWIMDKSLLVIYKPAGK